MKVPILVEPFLVVITLYLVYLLYLYAQEKRRRIEKLSIHTLWPIWPNPITSTSALEVMKFTILQTLLGHHFYVLSLSVLGPGVEKKIFKEIMHLYYMANVATPYHKNL